MQGRLLFFSLLAFLSLTFWDADAQDSGSLAFAAAEYELRLYDCAADETPGLLIAKAACQQEDGLWSESLETLGRIPMFALDADARRKVTAGILQGQLMSGRYDEFEVTLDEAMLMSVFSDELCSEVETYKASHPERYKKEDVAMLLSVLPGFGHFYAGKPVQGLGHLALNGVVIATGVASFCSGLYVCAFLGCGMVLARTHPMNSASAVKAAADHNDEMHRKRCEDMLDLVLRQYSGQQ